MTSINKILVANRGEIALRIMRTARSLGYRTVAVYSEADAQAAHVRYADQAVYLGGAPSSESYLNIASILAAAHESGADAIHPGYGFLAENGGFAEACLQAGLIFIGPSPQAIRSMGDKAHAKRLMRDAGIPCIPGYDGEDQSEACLAAQAERIGYPVMIKAAAGGGGRGMRHVVQASAFEQALASARSEALNAFGSEQVILERVVPDPRHIEIQVFADRHGNVVHMGERDCSVQRRHQKIIEEAPAPGMTPALRESMGRTAIAAAKAIAYEGAGTVEFLLDPDGNFYFMEMNTRLQVEHPVTEAITGLDLVALQIAVAEGAALPLAQSDISFAGHAIEVRLCAEDEANGFMPQSGTLDVWSVPETVRVDHAVASGSEISPYYDSMFAKLVAHGRNRDEARRKLIAALRDTVVLGIRTNRDFAARCLAHPVFAAGQVNTGFIDQYRSELQGDLREPGEDVQALALALCCHLGHSAGMQSGTHSLVFYTAKEGEAERSARVAAIGRSIYRVELAASAVQIELVAVDVNRVRYRVGRLSQYAHFHYSDHRLHIQCQGENYVFIDRTFAGAGEVDAAGTDGRVRASMSGRVAAMLVAAGERVQAGQPLVTLEAMKMEHTHLAPIAGTVGAVHVAQNDQALLGRVLVEILPEAGAQVPA